MSGIDKISANPSDSFVAPAATPSPQTTAAPGPIFQVTAAQEVPVPVRLEIRFGGSVNAGSRGWLEMRVVNTTSSMLQSVTVDVRSSSEDFRFEQVSAKRFQLRAFAGVPLSRGFTVHRDGRFDVTFQVTVDGDNGCSDFVATVPLNVNSVSPTTQIINYTDARRIEGRIVVGSDDIRLNQERPPESPLSSDMFVEVALAPPFDMDDLVKRIVRGHESHRYQKDRLSLHVQTDSGVRQICLLAKTEFTLGRRKDNDIVIRVLPETKENEELSGRIGRAHARVRLQPQRPIWENTSSSGTVVAGTPRAAGEAFEIRKSMALRPGNALSLLSELFSDALEAITEFDAKAYANFERYTLRHPPSDPETRNLTSLRLQRIDNLAGLEEYVVLSRGTLVGSGSTCAIRIDAPSVAAVHAKILFLGGAFWLEAAQFHRPTRFADRHLGIHELLPLRPQMTFHIGDVDVTVTKFEQHLL